jgi:hypothetical protein
MAHLLRLVKLPGPNIRPQTAKLFQDFYLKTVTAVKTSDTRRCVIVSLMQNVPKESFAFLVHFTTTNEDYSFETSGITHPTMQCLFSEDVTPHLVVSSDRSVSIHSTTGRHFLEVLP